MWRRVAKNGRQEDTIALTVFTLLVILATFVYVAWQFGP